MSKKGYPEQIKKGVKQISEVRQKALFWHGDGGESKYTRNNRNVTNFFWFDKH